MVGEAMRVVHDHLFHFEVLDPNPLVQKPLHYHASGEEWLRQKFAQNCEIGRLRHVQRGREADPVFTTNMVLVPKKGAWQEFADLVVVNTCIAPAIYPVPDCQVTLGALHSSCIMTALDIKSSFHNIPIPWELQPYCGLVIREGV